MKDAPKIDLSGGGGRLVYDKARRTIVAAPNKKEAEQLAQAIYTAKGLYLSPDDSMKAAQAAIDSWKCCGCGEPSPGRFRICDCLTTCVSDDAGKSAWKIDPIPHKLAETIRAKLLGVPPEDQDVVLEDADWLLILAALETVQLRPI